MKWTEELPTEPGWYFWKNYRGWPYYVVFVDEHLRVDGWGVKYQKGFWCGPIEEPNE